MSTLTGTTLYMQQSGSTIQYSTNNSTWTTVSSWPITLGTASATLRFTTDLSLNSVSQYFIIGAISQTIDGSYNKVYINNVNGYFGLVANGGAYTYNATTGDIIPTTNAFTNVTIQNIRLNSVNSSLLAVATNNLTSNNTTNKLGTGWICQLYFGRIATTGTSGCSVINCNTNGGTTSSSQNYTVYWTKSVRANIGISSNIYADNTGTTSGGCILGDYCTSNADNCYSTGTIGSYAGGIFGQYSSRRCTVTKTRSTGSIGFYGGGIMGPYSGATITHCYSTGSIAEGAGGIAGEQAQILSVTSSYSTGNMSGTTSGGIFGNAAGTSTSITRCYTTGSGTNPLTNSATTTKTRTYTTSGGTWIDASASSAFVTNDGSWLDVSVNSTAVPWKLYTITSTLYDSSAGTNITTKSASLSGSYNWSIASISITDYFLRFIIMLHILGLP